MAKQSKRFRALAEKRKEDALPLADAQVSASFTDRTGVSLRHLLNKLVSLCPACCLDDFFVSSIRTAVGDVLTDGG